METIASNSGLKPRGTYAKYGDEFRSKVARYAKENGVAAACCHVSKELEKPLPENTVRSWRNSMVNNESLTTSTVDSIQKQKRGRPLILGMDIDKKK